MITKNDINKEVELVGEVLSVGKPYVRITNAKFDD